MKGGRPDFFSSPVFLNGDHHHQQHQQQQLHAQHHHQMAAGIKLEREHSSSLSKLNHSSVASDNLSDNGGDSEREEKLGGGELDRKSPHALNATALATINNFYRNLDSQNNSFSGGVDNSQTTRSSRQSNSKSSSSLNNKQQQQQQQSTVEEELLQSPDIMRLYQVN